MPCVEPRLVFRADAAYLRLRLKAAMCIISLKRRLIESDAAETLASHHIQQVFASTHNPVLKEGMPGGGLTSQDIEEALSQAALIAIAARAGFATSKPEFDRDGIDLTVHGSGEMRPNIAVQLKASVNLTEKDGIIQYPLARRNYDLLRLPSQTPRMLVLMRLANDELDWLRTSQRLLSIRHCAYWLCLENAAATKNKTSVTVSVPTKNLLTVASLQDLMNRSRSGSLL